MTEIDDLFGELDERARQDPGLERYRVAGAGASWAAEVPNGWHVSDAVERIAEHGGWWPGEWSFPALETAVPLILTGDDTNHADRTVTWIGLGTVWERDWFSTPARREPEPSAPVFGFSTQALWTSMVFPTEAALLEAFLITYDKLGLDDRGEINPFFVEWVTDPPQDHEPPAALRVHQRLRERSKSWHTDHPCWVPEAMPRMSDTGWPPHIVAALLGES